MPDVQPADLFSATPAGLASFLDLAIADADIRLCPGWLAADAADALLETLREEIDWQQQYITLFGRRHALPRLTAWHGEAGLRYTYSGISSVALPWTDSLLRVKRDIEQDCGETFNSVLLNCYRNGADSVAWHSDNEPELGPAPAIASLSLGEVRTFQLQHRRDRAQRHSLQLPHGSLLLMRGATQANWLHRLPKSRRNMAMRINLTFRKLS